MQGGSRTGGHRIHVQMLSSGLWLLGGAVLARGSMLAGTLLAARLLGRAEFGRLALVQSTVGLFSVFATAGLALTAAKYVAELREDARIVAAHIGLTRVATATLAVIATAVMIWCVGSPLLPVSITGSAELFRIGAVLVTFSVVAGVDGGVLLGFQSFHKYALVAIGRGVAYLTLLPLGAIVGGVLGAVVGLVIAEGVGLTMTEVAVQRACTEAGVRVSYDWRGYPLRTAALHFAAPAFLSSIATMPAIWYANILLTRQPNGLAALGQFSAADKWKQLMLFVPSAMSPLMIPLLTRLRVAHDREGFRVAMVTNIVVNAAVVAAPIGLAVCWPGWMMRLFGADFAGGARTLTLLAISALPTVLNNVMGQALVSEGRMWLRCSLDVMLGVSITGASMVLIPRFYDIGLAGAYLIAFSLTAALMIIPVVRLTRR